MGTSFTGVTVTLDVLPMADAGRGEVKLKVGKPELLMGRETLGRSGNSGC